MKTRQKPKSPVKNPDHEKYKCAACQYSTSIFGNYRNHRKTHSNDKRFKCPECPFRSKAKNNVKNHLKNVHLPESRPFPCQHPGCSYAAKQKQNLVLHSKTHSGESRSFKCSHPNCGFSSNYKLRLVEHTRIHTGEQPYKCQFESCTYAARTQGHLVSHTRSHTKERPLKCSEPNCQFSAAYTSSILDHRRMNHPREGKKPPSFLCPVDGCPFTTKRANHLKNHLVVHSDSFLQCKSCPFQTRWKEALQRHIIRMHNSENPDPESRPFKCPEPNCTYVAKDKGALTSHVRRHTSTIVLSCPQDGCSYSSKVKANLRRHTKRHKGEKNYACGLCPAKYIENKSLQSHIRSHTNERPFKCEVAGCSFTTALQSNLKAHQKVHSDEKKLPCKFPGCLYTSKWSSVLWTHYQAVHKGNNRPFKCAICPYAAKTKGCLTKHTNFVHSDERPFKCPEAQAETGSGSSCSYPGSKTKRNLLNHMATHSLDKNHKCPYENCDYRAKIRSTLQSHLKTMHVKPIEFKSSICEYPSEFKEDFSTHIKRYIPKNSVHSSGSLSDGKKKCWVCDRGFNTNYELTRHLKSHKNQQP